MPWSCNTNFNVIRLLQPSAFSLRVAFNVKMWPVFTWMSATSRLRGVIRSRWPVCSWRGKFSFKSVTYKNRSSLWRVDSCQSPITLSVQLMKADESEPPVLQVECQLWNVSYDIPPLSCLRLLKGIGDGSQIGLIYVPLKSQLWLICTTLLCNKALYFERGYSSQTLNWYFLYSIWI